jgi:putative oxidoreductase
MKQLKRLFNTGTSEGTLDLAILIVRLSVGLSMLTHGWPKLNRLLEGGEISFSDPLGLGPVVSLVLAVFAEVVCSIFIALGLGTRLASIPLIVTMGVAAFIVHASDPFRGKEMAILYMVFYILLLLVGSRKYSMDRLLFH